MPAGGSQVLQAQLGPGLQLCGRHERAPQSLQACACGVHAPVMLYERSDRNCDVVVLVSLAET